MRDLKVKKVLPVNQHAKKSRQHDPEVFQFSLGILSRISDFSVRYFRAEFEQNEGKSAPLIVCITAVRS